MTERNPILNGPEKEPASRDATNLIAGTARELEPLVPNSDVWPTRAHGEAEHGSLDEGDDFELPERTKPTSARRDQIRADFDAGCK